MFQAFYQFFGSSNTTNSETSLPPLEDFSDLLPKTIVTTNSKDDSLQNDICNNIKQDNVINQYIDVTTIKLPVSTDNNEINPVVNEKKNVKQDNKKVDENSKTIVNNNMRHDSTLLFIISQQELEKQMQQLKPINQKCEIKYFESSNPVVKELNNTFRFNLSTKPSDIVKYNKKN